MMLKELMNNYEMMLNERFDGSTINENKKGLARELARMNLTLNTYTQWYWKTDLLNLMNFLKLRADSHAQYEIRAYADALMLDTLKKWVPILMKLLWIIEWVEQKFPLKEN